MENNDATARNKVCLMCQQCGLSAVAVQISLYLLFIFVYLPHVTSSPQVYFKNKVTRKPCCCRELPRDAEHLYRQLAPNPQSVQ